MTKTLFCKDYWQIDHGFHRISDEKDLRLFYNYQRICDREECDNSKKILIAKNTTAG